MVIMVAVSVVMCHVSVVMCHVSVVMHRAVIDDLCCCRDSCSKLDRITVALKMGYKQRNAAM